MPMERAERCARCGASLREATPDGLCVGCLLTGVLGALNEPEPPAEIESTNALLARRDFAGYELLHELGRGGMGVVFKARQKQPDRFVALKVITSGELASARMIERFHLEAKAAAGLHHPNIVAIHEVGRDRGWHYFSMQLVDGETLAARLGKMNFYPLPAAELQSRARTIIRMALAVHHAHQRGILHRDLKPGNILLNREGEPFLTDFGLAKLMEGGSEVTRSKTILGTPSYMAPEQGAGEGEISVATDVYGLGAILYELLCGRPPFQAENAARLLQKLMMDEPEPPSAVLARLAFRQSKSNRQPATRRITQAFPIIPKDLEVICLKCLEKKPARRYASALELAEDLERFLANRPIHARPITRVERAQKWVRRNPARAALAVVTGFSALALLIGLMVFNVRLGRARAEADRHAAQTRRQLSGKHMNDAARQAADGDSFRSLLSLCEAHRQAAGDAAAQEAIRERIVATSRLQPSLVALRKFDEAPDRFEFAGDHSSRLNIRLRRGQSLSWDLISNGVETSPEILGPRPKGLAQSADGKWLAVLDDMTVIVSNRITLSNSANLQVTGPLFDMTFSPDGRLFAMAVFRDQAVVYDTATWRPRGPRLEHESGANKAVFSPDGLLLATAGFDYQVRVRRVSDSRVMLPTFHHAALIEALAFSPDSRLLAVGDATGLVRIWDLSLEGATLALVDGSLQPLFRPVTDGVHQVVAHSDGLRVYNFKDGREEENPFEAPGEPAQVSFDSRNQRIAAAFASGELAVWDFQSRKKLLTLQVGGSLPAEPVNAALSPDGRRVLAVTAGGVSQIWNVDTGQKEGPEIPRGGKTVFVYWSPNGRWVSLGVEKTARVWDTQTDDWATGLLVGGAEDVAGPAAFSPDSSKLLLTFSNETIEPSAAQIYELPGGKPVGQPLRHGDGLATGLFSPDGSLVATGGEDNVARLWRVKDGSRAAPDLRHRSIVRTLAFRPDGKILASGEVAGAVRLWDVDRAEMIAPPFMVQGVVMGVGFSSDGKRLIVNTLKNECWLISFDGPMPSLSLVEQLAECETGLRANGSYGFLSSLPESLDGQFDRLRGKVANAGVLPADSVTWSLQRAAVARKEAAWSGALWHLSRLQKSGRLDEQGLARLEEIKSEAAAASAK